MRIGTAKITAPRLHLRALIERRRCRSPSSRGNARGAVIQVPAPITQAFAEVAPRGATKLRTRLANHSDVTVTDDISGGNDAPADIEAGMLALFVMRFSISRRAFVISCGSA
jgi:hypothetical protein